MFIIFPLALGAGGIDLCKGFESHDFHRAHTKIFFLKKKKRDSSFYACPVLFPVWALATRHHKTLNINICLLYFHQSNNVFLYEERQGAESKKSIKAGLQPSDACWGCGMYGTNSIGEMTDLLVNYLLLRSLYAPFVVWTSGFPRGSAEMMHLV